MRSAAIREVNFRATTAYAMSSPLYEDWADENGRPKVLIVDDQPLFRAALCWTLLQLRPTTEIVEAGLLSEAVAALKSGSYRLVLLADTLPDSSLSESIRTIRSQFSVEVAVVSSDDSRLAAHRAMTCGASECISKTAPLETITATLARLTGKTIATRPAVVAPRSTAQTCENALTPAQAKVLALVKEGQLNKQIAHEMGITESTVKAHVSAIFRKLKVQNRVQAIIAASGRHVRGPGATSFA